MVRRLYHACCWTACPATPYVGQSDEPWPVHSNWHAVGQLALLCLPLSILAIPWPACSDVCAIGRLALFLLLLCRTGGGGGGAAQRCPYTPVNSPSDQASGLKGGQWGKLPSTSTYLISVTGCLMLSSSNLAAGISEGDGLWFGSSMLYPVQ